MAIDSIENNEMSALSSMYSGNRPFANDKGGYDGMGVRRRSGIPDKKQMHPGYSNFLGIDIRGTAYHQQEADVQALETKFSPNALNALYPVAQHNCPALNAVTKSIVDQINILSQQIVTEKGAFVPRLQVIIRNLIAHRDKIVKNNAGMMCPDADTVEAEQEIDAALRQAYSMSSGTKIIMIAVAGVLTIGFVALYILNKKKNSNAA